jgi:cation transport ATPase
MSLNMTPTDPRTVVKSLGLFLLYAFMFWRLFKDNRGNRLIQCGSITLMLFLVMMALMRIPHLPIDYVAWLGPALFLLCMLTMFFLFQRGYRALRHRKIHSHSEAISSATAANGQNRTE